MTFRLKQHNSQVVMSAIFGLETKKCEYFTLTQLRKYIFDEYACHKSHDKANFEDIIYLTLESAVQHGFLAKSDDDVYSREEFELEHFPADILITDKISPERKRLQTRFLMKRLKIKDGQTLEEIRETGESESIIKQRLEKGVHFGFLSSENKIRRGKLYFRNVPKPDRGIICSPNYSFCSTMSKASSARSSV